jgi:hypothetical protein
MPGMKRREFMSLLGGAAVSRLAKQTRSKACGGLG